MQDMVTELSVSISSTEFRNWRAEARRVVQASVESLRLLLFLLSRLEKKGEAYAIEKEVGGLQAKLGEASEEAELARNQVGEVDDIVPAFLFLASPGARHMLGQTMCLSGGEVFV